MRAKLWGSPWVGAHLRQFAHGTLSKNGYIAEEYSNVYTVAQSRLGCRKLSRVILLEAQGSNGWRVLNPWFS